jgi:catecholate siderophore receptor
MSCQQLKSSANSSRSLASAVGVAIAAMSASHMAQAAEGTEDKAVALGATSITGEQADTAYKADDSA